MDPEKCPACSWESGEVCVFVLGGGEKRGKFEKRKEKRLNIYIYIFDISV